jgi:hypothetical protein
MSGAVSPGKNGPFLPEELRESAHDHGNAPPVRHAARLTARRYDVSVHSLSKQQQ